MDSQQRVLKSLYARHEQPGGSSSRIDLLGHGLQDSSWGEEEEVRLSHGAHHTYLLSLGRDPSRERAHPKLCTGRQRILPDVVSSAAEVVSWPWPAIATSDPERLLRAVEVPVHPRTLGRAKAGG